MKPAPLTYVRPASVEEAVAQMEAGGYDAKLMAGGQSLMPMLNLRIVLADTLVDIRRLAALRQVEDLGGAVRLGAGITHAEIQHGAVADPSNGLMPYVAGRIAYQAVRNRGTIGGSLALADPSADWVTTTAILGATIAWHGPQGPQSCPAEDFVTAAYTTRLDVADLLTGVTIPRLHPEARWGTYKLCRKTGEFAHAMAMVVREPAGARAFLGATNGAPLRLAETARVLAAFKAWEPSHASVLGAAFDADLAESGRTFTDVHAWQSRTCVVRASMLSFGVDVPRIEAA